MVFARSNKANELVAHYLELFEQLGDIKPKLVFGEHAFFFQGVMFALIWDGVLYVRVDATSRAKHVSLGLKPFVYVNREGRGTAMPYFQVPVSALDDADEMSAWARPAIAAALAASTKRKPSAAKTTTTQERKPRAKTQPAAKKAAVTKKSKVPVSRARPTRSIRGRTAKTAARRG